MRLEVSFQIAHFPVLLELDQAVKSHVLEARHFVLVELIVILLEDEYARYIYCQVYFENFC